MGGKISLTVAVSKLVGLFQVTAETSGQASGITYQTSENALKIGGEKTQKILSKNNTLGIKLLQDSHWI